MADGIVDARRGNDRGQCRGLQVGEPRGRLAKVAARGGLRPVGPRAELDDVDVELQDSPLGKRALHAEGDRPFAQLPPPGAVRREIQVLGELLRDGRAAVADPAALPVALQRAADGVPVHALVLVEPGVFRGDDGPGQRRTDARQRHGRPLEPRALALSGQLGLAPFQKSGRFRECRLERRHAGQGEIEERRRGGSEREDRDECFCGDPGLRMWTLEARSGGVLRLRTPVLGQQAARIARASFRTPSSASSRERFSGGRKRTALTPDARAISPFSRHAARVRSRVSLSGRSSAAKRPRPRTFETAGNSRASSESRASKCSPTIRAFATRFSSSMISRYRAPRTISTRLPPQVELIREETRKTFSTSSMRRLEAKPQTWVFLPKQKRSGSTPSCCQHHIEPVSPTPVCTSSKMSRNSSSSASARRRRKNSGRKWLSPPSPWIGSRIRAAMSPGVSAQAFRISRSTLSSAAATSAWTGGVTGKRSFGVERRGQSKTGK